MARKELIEKSIFAITEYYRGNLENYFRELADSVLWIGPRSGQMIRGRDNMIRIWNAAENNLRFSMSSISAKTVSTGRNNLEVLLEYYVSTYFPDGSTDKHHQRLHLSWGEAAHPDKAKIYMVHVSNIADSPDFDGRVYASSPEESRVDSVHNRVPEKKESLISVKGSDDVTYYLRPSSIHWAESANSGRNSLIHTPEKNVLCKENIRALEKKFDGFLLRCHASYLINPRYVTDLKRFAVTLDDGVSLPVPEKKYTAFREALNKWNQDHQK